MTDPTATPDPAAAMIDTYLADVGALRDHALWVRIVGPNWTPREFADLAARCGQTPEDAIHDLLAHGPWSTIPADTRAAIVGNLLPMFSRPA